MPNIFWIIVSAAAGVVFAYLWLEKRKKPDDKGESFLLLQQQMAELARAPRFKDDREPPRICRTPCVRNSPIRSALSKR
ncbi:MAG: hypothetical protein WDN09_04150 [bacterium]